MSGQIFVGGAWRTLSSGQVCLDGTTFRPLTRGVACLDGTNWVNVLNFVPPMSVSIAPSEGDAIGTPSKPGSLFLSAGPFTATPSGGRAPFTYAWSIISYSGTTPGLTSTTSAKTIAEATVPYSTSQTAVIQVVVTDSLGTTATATATAQFTNNP